MRTERYHGYYENYNSYLTLPDVQHMRTPFSCAIVLNRNLSSHSEVVVGEVTSLSPVTFSSSSWGHIGSYVPRPDEIYNLSSVF